MNSPIYEISVEALNGATTGLDNFAGKVMLIVNTASQCGFTGQYAGLEQLHQQYKDKGLVVLAFPCNQFGGQEPGSAEEIAHFCETKYNITFPVFAKIDVNGENAHPLYAYLKQKAKGLLGSEAIKWNFTKFLVDRRGEQVTRYAPNTTPESLAKDIEALL